MVQIVGKDPAQVKRTTCWNCASILEYTLSEIRSRVSTDYAGGSDEISFINCPSCGRELHVSKY